ncbi:MAG TPA: RcnB family protein [Caulobacteraceae bacterium]
MIHRGENGYSRHYVGASSAAALGSRPRRKAGGPTYLYHGRRYAPIWAPRYHWPRGHPYHRFHRHDRFPRIFLIPEYFIDDYDDYGVAPPPVDAQWVRYGEDLVLVDLDSGDILNVITGFFAESADDTAAPEDEGPPPDDAAAPDEAPAADAAPPPPDDSAAPAEPPQFISFSAR